MFIAWLVFQELLQISTVVVTEMLKAGQIAVETDPRGLTIAWSVLRCPLPCTELEDTFQDSVVALKAWIMTVLAKTRHWKNLTFHCMDDTSEENTCQFDTILSKGNCCSMHPLWLQSCLDVPLIFKSHHTTNGSVLLLHLVQFVQNKLSSWPFCQMLQQLLSEHCWKRMRSTLNLRFEVHPWSAESSTSLDFSFTSHSSGLLWFLQKEIMLMTFSLPTRSLGELANSKLATS